MSFDVQRMIHDANGNHVPQFFNPANDAFEPILGARPWRLDPITIPSGASEPAAGLDLRGFMPVKLYIPAAWTTAGIFWKESVTLAGTYAAIKNEGGLTPEIASGYVTVGLPMALDTLLPFFRGVSYLKVCSGTIATPVNQAAARTLYLLSV